MAARRTLKSLTGYSTDRRRLLTQRKLRAGQAVYQVHVGAEYDVNEVEFLRALQAYQKANHRKFPAFTEVLTVLKSLGWRKTAEVGPLPKWPLEREEESRE